MAQLTSQHLRRWAQELDDEERGERETELAAKVDRLEAAAKRGGLSEEQAQTLERAQALLDALEEEDKRAAADESGSSSSSGSNGGGGSDDDDEDTPARRTATRKGRKRGNAYDYDVDEKGRPVKLGVAKVYQGDDEPETVEYELDDDEGGDA